MLGLKTYRLMFERFDMLAHCSFRVRLSGVGISVFFSLSLLRWGFGVFGK
jgi:hypothetical protein